MDSQLRYGRLEYLVRWKGYGHEENSWIIEKDLNAPDLVTTFYRTNPNAPKCISTLAFRQMGFWPHYQWFVHPDTAPWGGCQGTTWWGQQPSTIVPNQSQCISDHSQLLQPIAQLLQVTFQSPDPQSPRCCNILLSLLTLPRPLSLSPTPWNTLDLAFMCPPLMVDQWVLSHGLLPHWDSFLFFYHMVYCI
jgi:Chromo (CHRromatin Organisation MOdifier) domain